MESADYRTPCEEFLYPKSGALGFPGTLFATADAALEEAWLLSRGLLQLAHVLAGCPDDLGVFHMALPCVSEELAEDGLGEGRHRYLAGSNAY
jgi:hypothetical protein